MTLKLTLELSEDDLAYFQKVLDETCARNANRPEQELVDGVRRLLQESRAAELPEYVRQRLDDLGTLIALLEDAEWPLEQQDRRRILAAVSYFADAKDIIPDRIPGLGYLDDALMAELVMLELKHDLEGYRDFCEFRRKQEEVRGAEADLSREDWLAAERRQMLLRIKRRREEWHRHASIGRPTDPILRFDY